MMCSQRMFRSDSSIFGTRIPLFSKEPSPVPTGAFLAVFVFLEMTHTLYILNNSM